MEGIGFKPMNIHSSNVIKLSLIWFVIIAMLIISFMKLPQPSLNTYYAQNTRHW